MEVVTRFYKQGNSGYLSRAFPGSHQQHIRQAGLQLQVQIAVSFFFHISLEVDGYSPDSAIKMPSDFPLHHL